eukprot:CAMPEP_0181493628 /NCGR_PEP_ID=MMETSP1110-20121109/51326_1 /TAXON_ID=174948 /ORGANISM="Symbiodinium sp., Strain CCMP421" /LENGTH=40 /DNA_ID= /DNA_START= /DNA_END= /DNA_ORIENTATION=
MPFAAGFEASAPPSSMEQPRSSQCPSASHDLALQNLPSSL